MLQDNQQARQLLPGGEYIRVKNDAPPLNAQEFFFRQAYREAEQPEEAPVPAQKAAIPQKSGILRLFKTIAKGRDSK